MASSFESYTGHRKEQVIVLFHNKPTEFSQHEELGEMAIIWLT
jgi:hypothetical protein